MKVMSKIVVSAMFTVARKCLYGDENVPVEDVLIHRGQA